MYGLDLFSGIGGITKALEQYVQPVAYCEIDKYARGVLLSRMATGGLPIAPVWDDVTTLRGSNLPTVDIIYGGFPCQDISVAGRQVGLGGERSGLFFEVVRLAGEIKPSFIFLENVPNIRTKGLGRVLKELDKLGYDCRWSLLSAADVGANHKRQRWFLLGHTNAERHAAQSGYIEATQASLVRSSGTGTNVAHAKGEQDRRVQPVRFQSDAGAKGQDVADATSTGWRGLSSGAFAEHPELSKSGWWDVEPNVGRVANGVFKRVDRLRALGNAVVSAQVKKAFESLMGIKQ